MAPVYLRWDGSKCLRRGLTVNLPRISPGPPPVVVRFVVEARFFFYSHSLIYLRQSRNLLSSGTRLSNSLLCIVSICKGKSASQETTLENQQTSIGMNHVCLSPFRPNFLLSARLRQTGTYSAAIPPAGSRPPPSSPSLAYCARCAVCSQTSARCTDCSPRVYCCIREERGCKRRYIEATLQDNAADSTEHAAVVYSCTFVVSNPACFFGGKLKIRPALFRR